MKLLPLWSLHSGGEYRQYVYNMSGSSSDNEHLQDTDKPGIVLTALPTLLI